METRRHGEKKFGGAVTAPSRLREPDSPLHPLSPSPPRRVAASPRPRVAGSLGPITLLTDFGTADYFVGALKGVILAANPGANIIDISHEIAPWDTAGGAFTLLAAYGSFPTGTVHVAVVDPGVGSSRRPVLVLAGKQFFVGPDNGIFSYIIEREAGVRVFHLTNDDYYRHPVSPTFHGRDVFAPVAAALSMGVSPEDLGVEIQDYARLPTVTPSRLKNGSLRARILHIDRFGNCVTTLTPQELTTRMIESGARLRVNGRIIKSFRRFFSDEGKGNEKLFAVWGSAGFLELAATNESAAKVLKAKRGQTVLVSTS